MRSRCFRICRRRDLLPAADGVRGWAKYDVLISLDQAIDLALAHNHSLKATRTLILQNQAQEITANLRPNPSFGPTLSSSPFSRPGDFSADDLN